MSAFEDFLRWYNKEQILSALVAFNKTMAFYQDKDIDILKLGSTSPKVAKVHLHESENTSVYLLTHGFKETLDKT